MLQRQAECKATGKSGNGFGLTLANEVQSRSREQWATPQARDHFPAHTPDYVAAKKAQGHGMRNLNDEASQWRTPSDPSKRGGSQPPEKRAAGGHTINLDDQAEHWSTPRVARGGYTRDRGDPKKERLTLEGQSEAWSTPRASDGEKGGPNMAFGAGGTPLPTQAAHWPTPLTADDGRKVTARSAQQQLCNVAESWPNSPSRPDLPTIAGGRSSETRRRLNPLFVEWLMGWPEGLSGFDTAATASCHSPAPSPGCGCMDCWLNRQREMLADLLAIEAPMQGNLW